MKRSASRRGRRCAASGTPARAVAAALAALALAACASFPGGLARVEPLHLSELVERGDPARRASLRLVLVGLREDQSGSRARARSSYERAIQVDPTNPYAYLAFARHQLDWGSPERASAFLDQAQMLLAAEGGASARVEPHLQGLRGAIALSSGDRATASEALGRARRLAPEIWADGRLSPEELL